LLSLALVACTSEEPETSILVTLVADGRQQLYSNTEPITVGQFLRSPEVDIELGTLDRVNPPTVTQISDGMTITVVRVREEEECEQIEIPYEITRRRFEGLPPGEESLQQAGSNGLREVCYRVTYTDDTRSDRIQIRDNVIEEPREEIIFIGISDEVEPVSISGTLAYINNQNIWVMRGSSTTKTQVTFSGDLDGRIFSLSSDGRKLLFSRAIESEDTDGISISAFNQLYLINGLGPNSARPLPLSIQNVLFAEWRPGYENTFAYSGAEPSDFTGWDAYNDLWIATVNPENGDIIDIDQVIEENSGGLYGWYGTDYAWSPDGERIAYVRANGVGLVDLNDRQLADALLLEYDLLNLGTEWSWRTTVSWAPDSSLLVSTVHGPPLGNEHPETSPVFDIGVAAIDGSFAVSTLVERVGIWSTPQFSPEQQNTNEPFPDGHLAYLQAREWEDSITSEYDLIIADRDGSNARVIFPESGQPGLRDFAQDFVWSPDGQEIAFIYQGNLWKINVETGIAHQLTLDGGAESPVWTR
jgi:hypothetical protein